MLASKSFYCGRPFAHNPPVKPTPAYKAARFVQLTAKSLSRMGSRRIRFPVAAKIAFAMAGAITGTAGSPSPPGCSAVSFHQGKFFSGARYAGCQMPDFFQSAHPFLRQFVGGDAPPHLCRGPADFDRRRIASMTRPKSVKPQPGSAQHHERADPA